MKPTIKIKRHFQDQNQTSGTCTVFINDIPLFSALSLERGWRENQRNVSCIPLGEYQLKLEYSNRFKKNLWEVKNVPNRSECKFHSANFWYQLNGCIALGLRSKHLNVDNYRDLTNSKSTMRSFHYVLKSYKEATLIIE